MQYTKGTIIVSENQRRDAAWHPIVYWKPDQDPIFTGLVLTHSANFGNLPMKASYFEYDLGSGYSFDENHRTYLVKCLFMKPGDWGPYMSVGKLTEEGIRFAGHVVKGVEPIYWEDYLETMRKNHG